MSRPRRPTKVNVGPFTYMIQYVKLDDETAGETSNWALTIKINDQPSTGVQKEALVHEILHACHQASGISDDATWNVEDFVTRVAPHLLDALRRSPGLAAYLLED